MTVSRTSNHRQFPRLKLEYEVQRSNGKKTARRNARTSEFHGISRTPDLKFLNRASPALASWRRHRALNRQTHAEPFTPFTQQRHNIYIRYYTHDCPSCMLINSFPLIKLRPSRRYPPDSAIYSEDAPVVEGVRKRLPARVVWRRGSCCRVDSVDRGCIPSRQRGGAWVTRPPARTDLGRAVQ